MRNIISMKLQRFFVFHPNFLTLLLVILLLVLVLGVFGQWYLLFVLAFMAIFFSISELLFSTMYQLNRNASSDDCQHPFSCILYSLADPEPSCSMQERIERQEEEFKPFVFKD